MASCIVCDGSRWKPLYDVLIRCEECGFIRAAEFPPEGEIKQLYSADYFEGQEYGSYLADRRVHEINFQSRIDDMRRHMPKLTSIFEIGCAYGLFLSLASRAGWKSAGTDVSAEAVRYAQEELKQAAMCGDFVTSPPSPGSFDAICMWDTIEHLAHPEFHLATMHSMLPPGGWLFLTTGDIGSRMARRRGRKWRMIHPPTHLQYFSQATMRRFLARYQFETVEIRSIPIYRTLHSVLTALIALRTGSVRTLAQAMASVIPQAIQDRAGLWLNLGDIMFVAAQKRPH